AIAAMSAGMQLTGHVLQSGPCVQANIEIGNYTKEVISTTGVDKIHGEVAYSPLNIAPADNMRFVVRKSSYGFYG
ncbi:hypothetical protein PMAYCL1PPCAC_21541, partial [Pristionchus mayeri]